MWVWFLGGEDPLEEGEATRSSILVWRIPWTEEPGRLCSLGSHRVGHNWRDLAHIVGLQCCVSFKYTEGDSVVCVCVCVCVLVAQSCPSDPMDCSLPGSSVHGFSRQEKWVAIPFSRGPSRPRDQTQVSCIAGGFFTLWATREAQIQFYIYIRLFFYKFFSHLGGVLSTILVL